MNAIELRHQIERMAETLAMSRKGRAYLRQFISDPKQNETARTIAERTLTMSKLSEESYQGWLESYRRAGVTFHCSAEACRNQAAWWLYAPDGKPNPGGSICTEHGRQLIREMWKVEEEWNMVPMEHHLASAAALRERR